jgi:hypothetical protein
MIVAEDIHVLDLYEGEEPGRLAELLAGGWDLVPRLGAEALASRFATAAERFRLAQLA